MKETIKSFKGFDKNLQCRGFQYEVGETYEEQAVELCAHGFHACETPLDVFRYYPPATSRYCEVEQSGDVQRDKDRSKVASSRIKIAAEIGVRGLARAHVEWVKEHTTTEYTDPERATAGYAGAATAGYAGAATAGYYGAATAGYYGAATAGEYGAATSRGSSRVGQNGLAVARGNNVRVKGGLGALLVIAEEDTNNYDVREWKAFLVDGVDIKADVWYRLENGELKEVCEND